MNRTNFFKVNHGRPQNVALARPLAAEHVKAPANLGARGGMAARGGVGQFLEHLFHQAPDLPAGGGLGVEAGQEHSKGLGGVAAQRAGKVFVASKELWIEQEKKIRSGTVNVAGAVGMAAAFHIRAAEMAEEGRRLAALRNDLWDRLVTEIAGVSVNGPRELRLPGNLNVSFERIEADSLIVAMRRFALSSASACSSGEHGPSPVLTAIGISERAALGSIRMGLGRSNTAGQMDMLAGDLKRAVARLREISVV